MLCFSWRFHIWSLLYGKVFYLLNYLFLVFSVWFLRQIFPKPLCEKCPNTEIFLVRIFPHLHWIRRDTKYWSGGLTYNLLAEVISKNLFLWIFMMIMYQPENSFKDVIELFGQVILTKYRLHRVATKFRYYPGNNR